MKKITLGICVVLCMFSLCYLVSRKPKKEVKVTPAKVAVPKLGGDKTDSIPNTVSGENSATVKGNRKTRPGNVSSSLYNESKKDTTPVVVYQNPPVTASPTPPAEIKREGESIRTFLAVRNTPSEFHSINSQEFTTVTGAQGTVMKFVPSTFRSDDSTYYDGPVRIEMKEIDKRSQMVFSNVSTTSNGDVIESAGMIYWNATAEDGTQLTMDTGSNALVTFSGNKNFKDYQLFTGQMNDGVLDWQLRRGVFTNQQLAVLPVASVPFRHFKIKYSYHLLPQDAADDWNEAMSELMQGATGTALCTVEFMERLEVIRNMGWDMSILQFYFDNSDNLNKADSLAVAQVMMYSSDITKSNYKISRRNLCTGLSKKTWLKYHAAKFRNFFVESRSYTNKVVVARSDMRNVERLAKKLSDMTYAWYIFYHPKYGYNYSACNSEARGAIFSNRGMLTSTVSCLNYKSITFKIPQMGYINCDHFINQPVKKNVFVRVNNSNEAGDVTAFVVFRDINSMMSGGGENEGGLVFYNIPVGMKVSLVVIGNKDGRTSIAIQDIKVDKEIHTEVTLEPAKKEEIEDCIKKVADG